MKLHLPALTQYTNTQKNCTPFSKFVYVISRVKGVKCVKLSFQQQRKIQVHTICLSALLQTAGAGDTTSCHITFHEKVCTFPCVTTLSTLILFSDHQHLPEVFTRTTDTLSKWKSGSHSLWELVYVMNVEDLRADVISWCYNLSNPYFHRTNPTNFTIIHRHCTEKYLAT